MPSTTTSRLRGTMLLLAGVITLTACGGTAESAGGAATGSIPAAGSAADSGTVGPDSGSPGAEIRTDGLASSQGEPCVDQFGRTWPEPEPGLERYDERGVMWSDACGNQYGYDGRLVRTVDGACVQGLAPGTDPAANICLDPSLDALTGETLDQQSEEWERNGWTVTNGD
ncbi:hypothetical protein [Blastococcus xanthinilyticus]|uniref:Uncharacterized protein n=1 Tax=Blastococcus xanthinilyticus TaxID=1564164 RepID=A0A5S5D1L0_9ACTN|nr:hypothetical protein [Blastococcus xanthinilyticus]TYP88996.1 hypothetical protein BD833_103152 [Blastococcus xanthinilyticus]